MNDATMVELRSVCTPRMPSLPRTTLATQSFRAALATPVQCAEDRVSACER